MGTDQNEPTASVRERVLAVRARAAERGVETNAAIPADRLDDLAPLHPDASDLLAQALRSGRLSARGLHRVRRVARTVADLHEAPNNDVSAAHVAIALSLRVDAAGATPDDRALTA